jgi:hypothetical protein
MVYLHLQFPTSSTTVCLLTGTKKKNVYAIFRWPVFDTKNMVNTFRRNTNCHYCFRFLRSELWDSLSRSKFSRKIYNFYVWHQMAYRHYYSIHILLVFPSRTPPYSYSRSLFSPQITFITKMTYSDILELLTMVPVYSKMRGRLDW